MKSERVEENSNKCLQTWRNSDTIATDDNGMHKNDGLLYNVEPNTINYYLKKIFLDGELEEQSVIRKFRITASNGKSYNTNHNNLKAIIAVGNKSRFAKSCTVS